MRKFILGFIAFATTFSVSSQSIKTPPPSPPQTIKQDFGLSSIELSYSRPGVKGRKVFGDLVPYAKVWRTGANSATTIDFADDVALGTQKFPPVNMVYLPSPIRIIGQLLLQNSRPSLILLTTNRKMMW